jgi:hypothetical protein
MSKYGSTNTKTSKQAAGNKNKCSEQVRRIAQYEKPQLTHAQDSGILAQYVRYKLVMFLEKW